MLPTVLSDYELVHLLACVVLLRSQEGVYVLLLFLKDRYLCCVNTISI